MKYNITRYKLDAKNNILQYQNLAKVAKEIGCSSALLCRARKGTRSLSEEVYQKIKKIVSGK